MPRRAYIQRQKALAAQQEQEEENIILPNADAVDQAKFEADVETDEVLKIKNLILQLRKSDPEEEVTCSIRVRLREGKPWHVIESRQFPLDTFDIENLMADIQHDHGDGNYRIVMYLRGRVIKAYDFYIGDPRIERKPQTTQTPDRQDLLVLFPAMMKQSSESNQQMMTMLMAVMQEGRASSDRMMQAQMQTMGLLIPAMMGDKTDPTVIMARFAEIQKSMQPTTQGGMTEALDILVKAKALFGEGNNGKESNVWDTIREVAAPAAAALAPLLAGQNGQAPPNQQPRLQAPGSTPQATRPNPVPVPQVQQETAPATPKDYDDPILNLIGPDILFFAQRGYSADVAADTLTDKLDENSITLAQLQAHVNEWLTNNPSGDWLETLASRGLDLRPYAVWTQQVFAGIVQNLSSNGEDENNPGRQGGGQGDDAGNGEAS